MQYIESGNNYNNNHEPHRLLRCYRYVSKIMLDWASLAKRTWRAGIVLESVWYMKAWLTFLISGLSQRGTWLFNWHLCYFSCFQHARHVPVTGFLFQLTICGRKRQCKTRIFKCINGALKATRARVSHYEKETSYMTKSSMSVQELFGLLRVRVVSKYILWPDRTDFLWFIGETGNCFPTS